MRKAQLAATFATIFLSGNAFATPLDEVLLSGKGEHKEVSGSTDRGDRKFIRFTTKQATINFTVSASNGACSVDVEKTPMIEGIKTHTQFPLSWMEKTNSGDSFTFTFSQTRGAWAKSIPCTFVVLVST